MCIRLFGALCLIIGVIILLFAAVESGRSFSSTRTTHPPPPSQQHGETGGGTFPPPPRSDPSVPSFSPSGTVPALPQFPTFPVKLNVTKKPESDATEKKPQPESPEPSGDLFYEELRKKTKKYGDEKNYGDGEYMYMKNLVLPGITNHLKQNPKARAPIPLPHVSPEGVDELAFKRIVAAVVMRQLKLVDTTLANQTFQTTLLSKTSVLYAVPVNPSWVQRKVGIPESPTSELFTYLGIFTLPTEAASLEFSRIATAGVREKVHLMFYYDPLISKHARHARSEKPYDQDQYKKLVLSMINTWMSSFQTRSLGDLMFLVPPTCEEQKGDEECVRFFYETLNSIIAEDFVADRPNVGTTISQHDIENAVKQPTLQLLIGSALTGLAIVKTLDIEQEFDIMARIYS